MIKTDKTEVLGEKPAPQSLCSTQNLHGTDMNRTRASALGGQRQTATAMAQRP